MTGRMDDFTIGAILVTVCLTAMSIAVAELAQVGTQKPALWKRGLVYALLAAVLFWIMILSSWWRH